MCGRFALANPKFERIEAALGVSFAPVRTHYNVSPSQSIPVVREVEGQGGAARFELLEMKWGLVPHWSREPTTKYSTFNARAETAETKPAFREPFQKRRCLIPASGFYEWKQSEGHKQPYYLTDAEGQGLAFAGLWDHWRGEGSELLSCAILVTTPNALLARIHDRMPVILDPADYLLWLDPHAAPDDLRALLRPYPAERMRGWPVSAAVGNPRNESPSNVEPVGILS